MFGEVSTNFHNLKKLLANDAHSHHLTRDTKFFKIQFSKMKGYEIVSKNITGKFPAFWAISCSAFVDKEIREKKENQKL